MKYIFSNHLALITLGLVVSLSPAASARDQVLPAGTILQCTLNEPNFSSATVEIGDPVLCHLRGAAEFGEQVFPRGSYLVGHLESVKDPGHFFGKGYLKLQFDRIGLPSGDLPLDAKAIATRGYKVDREGKIDGKGHAKRDAVEWMLPPLWPWKVIMLPARGPRPKLKGETTLSLRLMDDVQIPQAPAYSSDVRSSLRPQRQSFQDFNEGVPGAGIRNIPTRNIPMPEMQTPHCLQTFGPEWHFFGQPRCESLDDSQPVVLGPTRGPALGPALRYIPSGDQPVVETAAASYVSTIPGPPWTVTANTPPPPGVPLFVMKDGAMLALENYAYANGRITYTLANGASRVIDSEEVDWSGTLRLNAQRGVRISLHSGRADNLKGAQGPTG